MSCKSLPGPCGLPLSGSVYPFVRHGILGAFTSLADRYGPCYRLPLPLGYKAVCLGHPDGVERVLRSNRENYRKGSIYDGTRLLLGNALVTAEGEGWQHHRNLAQPAFKNERLAEFWPDPLRFDPERFSCANNRKRHSFSWFPFSAGPRVCIGKYFSLYEAQLVLAMVMREFRVRLMVEQLEFRAEGTLHPDRPVMVRLESRR